MKKHIFFILSFIAINTYAMKMEVETGTSYRPCRFIDIPNDVMDLIASYLTFDDIEAEQEYAERTKTIKMQEIPKKYLAHLPTQESMQCFYCVLCPNNKIIAMLEKYEDDDLYCGLPEIKNPALVIVDKKDNQKMYEETLSEQGCFKVAVSRNGIMFAFIHREEVSDNTDALNVLTLDYKTILSIKNIVSKQRESHTIPDSFLIASDPYSAIAFNKQGTHIIIHGIDFQELHKNSSPIKTIGIKQNPIRHHMTIPLTVNTPNLEAGNKKTLAKYFVQQMVCKDLTKQITLTQ